MESAEKSKDETELSAKTEKKLDLPKKKSSKKSKILIILGVIIAFIVGLIIIANVATSAPLKVSDELIKNIQALDSTAAYNLLSSDAKAVTGSSEFAVAIEQIGPILNGKAKMNSKEVSSETGVPNTATVIYTIPGSDGIEYRFTVELTQNDGKWQVDTFLSEDPNSTTNGL